MAVTLKRMHSSNSSDDQYERVCNESSLNSVNNIFNDNNANNICSYSRLVLEKTDLHKFIDDPNIKYGLEFNNHVLMDSSGNFDSLSNPETSRKFFATNQIFEIPKCGVHIPSVCSAEYVKVNRNDFVDLPSDYEQLSEADSLRYGSCVDNNLLKQNVDYEILHRSEYLEVSSSGLENKANNVSNNIPAVFHTESCSTYSYLNRNDFYQPFGHDYLIVVPDNEHNSTNERGCIRHREINECNKIRNIENQSQSLQTVRFRTFQPSGYEVASVYNECCEYNGVSLTL